MGKTILIIIVGLIIGLGSGYIFKNHSGKIQTSIRDRIIQKEIIGFIPYWLAGKAKKDYSRFITTLTYFGLTIDTDGSILKLINDQEEDPGWHALHSGAMDTFFTEAQNKGIKKSLLIFAADQEHIEALIATPEAHAKHLIEEVEPIMKQYRFTDLNLDIESVAIASAEAQSRFTRFVRVIKQEMSTRNLGTLTLEASPTVFIKPYLINPKDVAPLVDFFVLMTYDYHYPGSYVTGPISPLQGADTIAEYDIEKGVQAALSIMPKEKIIMGIPLYGYGWESIGDTPRSAVMPGSGVTFSNKSVEELLSTCASCSAQFDTTAQESYVIYKDSETGTYRQIFYPDSQAVEAKLKYARSWGLKGVALWALGYEGKTILDPLQSYK